ncbi:MAG: Smr/MutS family protein [Holosporales bacterium]|jgi:DNA-nicking Smr family endonuclease|nr:Smr/MutS family protein [Holosporales bacterium]
MKRFTKEEQDLWDSINKDIKRIIHNTVVQSAVDRKTVLRAPVITTDIRLASAEVTNKSFCVEYLKQRKKIRHIRVERTVDLHGLTLQQSLSLLTKFFYTSQAYGNTWVKVITGKSGLLCKEIHTLLKENADATSMYSVARANDGGNGAFYVKIRARRRKSFE